MKIFLSVVSLVVLSTVAVNDSQPESDAITKTALDYIEGWYDGNAGRMENALHPDLAKRVLVPDRRSKGGKIEHMSAMKLVQATRAQRKRPTRTEERTANVTILDVMGNAASVKAEMHDWIDYMHLSKINGQWKIVNVLWELTPEIKKKRGFPDDL